MKLNDITNIRQQVYYIMTGISGSWLWEATYPHNQDHEFCERFMKEYLSTHDGKDPQIQELIDEDIATGSFNYDY